MRRSFSISALVFTALLALLFTYQPVGGGGHPGQGVVIELDNAFIQKYQDRATITSKFTIAGMSAVHLPKNDGEIHIGGWSDEAGLAGVSEVMNAGTIGRAAAAAFRKAEQPVTVTGAWRLWAEHAGTGSQMQAKGPNPNFDPQVKSNPEHVFEIHPVTMFAVDGKKTSTTNTIGETPGFTPHDATKAFVLGYEKLPCKIIPQKGDRTRIITQSLGFNFTEFAIRLDGNVVGLDDGGHAAICTVFDTDGELLVRNRRMVFMEGTNADDEVQGKKKGDLLQVIGIPRISLKLIWWRLQNKNATDKDGNPFDISPLEWRLPYEMIIVAAKPFSGALD